jgi:hypothetical protein
MSSRTWITRFSRILADKRLRPILAAACLLPFAFGAARAADPPEVDENLPARQDSTVLRQVTYSFHERFHYDLSTDSTLYGTVEHFKSLYPESYWTEQLGKLTNEDGTLAWLVSQDMLALVVMYDLTGDPWYLRMLGRYAEGAMAVRDDVLGKKDADGHTAPAWGSTRYDLGERRVYLVHSGLIVQPILEYAVRAPKLDGWSSADEARRKKLIERCRSTLLFHDYQIDPDTSGDETAYIAGHEERDRRNAYQPFNRQNLFARDFYLMYQLTDDASYLERSRKLYTFFRKNIERTPSDAYIWEYEPLRWVGGPIRTSVCDDMSHASYAIQPVIQACRDEFIFTKADLARFARTFTKYVYLGDGVFQTSIGCRVAFTPRILDRLYGWLPLAQADPQIYWLIRRFLMKNVEKPPALAVAYLISYRPKGLTGVDTRAH